MVDQGSQGLQPMSMKSASCKFGVLVYHSSSRRISSGRQYLGLVQMIGGKTDCIPNCLSIPFLNLTKPVSELG